MTGVGWLLAAAASVDEEGLRLLTKDDYHSFLEECGDKLAVVDFFTDWCDGSRSREQALVGAHARQCAHRRQCAVRT